MSLKVENVSLVYGDGDEQVEALANVNMDLQPGQLMAVLGPFGAGKSSLLAVFGALQTPSEGRIWIGETQITGTSGPL